MPTDTPLNGRRIAADLNTPEIDITATGDRISITAPTAALDRLLDRIEPTRRPADCTGQLALFDPAPYTAIQQLPAPSDPQLSLTSSTDRGAA